MNNRRASLQGMADAVDSHELALQYLNRSAAGFEGWLLDRMAHIVLQARRRHAILSVRQFGMSDHIPDTDLVVIMDMLAYAKELSRLQQLSQFLKIRIAVHRGVTIGQAADTDDFTRSLGLAIMLGVSLYTQSTIDAQLNAISNLPPAPTGPQYRYCENPECNMLILTALPGPGGLRKGEWVVSCQQAVHQQKRL